MKNVFEKHIIDIYEVLGRHSSFCGELRRIAYAAHLNTCNTYLLMDIFDGMVRSLHTPCVWGVVVSRGQTFRERERLVTIAGIPRCNGIPLV